MFKISFLKIWVTSSQESNHHKLGHRLDSVLVKNLMKDSVKKYCAHDVIATLEAGLAMKIGNNWKTKSLKTSIDFLLKILDENNEVKVYGLECKSRLTNSA